jgi:auxin-responsive protein IAA
MHPWSLAARQQKAAAEQDRTPPTTYMSRWAKMLRWNTEY